MNHLPTYALVATLGILVLLPIFRLVLVTGVDGIAALLNYPNIWKIVRTTVWLALGSLAIALVFGTFLAWCAAHTPRKPRAWVSAIPILSLVVPAIANTTGWVFLLSPSAGYLNAALRRLFGMSGVELGPIDIFSVEWIVLLTGFTFTGYVYLYVHSSMEAIGTELQAAASVFGASGWRVFRTITLPLIRPAIMYSSGIVFLLGLGQFTNPLLLGTAKHIDVLTTVLFRIQAAYPINYALGAAVSAPLILAGILMMVFQQRMIGNQTRYVVVTGKSSYVTSAGSWWAAVPIFLFAFFSMVLPIGALLLVALSRFWSANVDLGSLTTAHIVNTFTDRRVLSALRITLTATVLAMVIVIPVGLLAARAVAGVGNARYAAGRTVDLLATLPLSMPAAIFGFAALFTYTGTPFHLYGTLALVVLVYVTLMIPHAVRPQLSTLLSLGREHAEASRMSGANAWRTFIRIELPMMRGGVVTAAAMVFILLSHEFAASLMVVGERTQTLGTLLYQLFEGGVYPQVAGVALLMVVLTFSGLIVVFAVSGGRALAR